MNSWLSNLLAFIHKKPALVIQFTEQEWSDLEGSANGLSQFTIARYHSTLEKVGVPTLCLLIGNRERKGIYLGLLSAKSQISTLEIRIRVRNVRVLVPETKAQLFGLLKSESITQKIEGRLEGNSTTLLTPMLSKALIEVLARIPQNVEILETITEMLIRTRSFNSKKVIQEDAIKSVLNIFRLPVGQMPEAFFIRNESESALGDVIPIVEDSVIEHDARQVVGYDIVESDLTGRAMFQRGGRRLEVYTANRKSLEKVLGVDLIYLNLAAQSIVMLQYKMLEPDRDVVGKVVDWIFRPDDQLGEEIARMKRFPYLNVAGRYEYRFNSEIFYLKFIKRDGAVTDGGIVMPLPHFEIVNKDPSHRSTRGALKISYKNLSGKYLRHSDFISLMASGYIGAHSQATETFKRLIELVISGGRSVVAAIESNYLINTTEQVVDENDEKYGDLPF